MDGNPIRTLINYNNSWVSSVGCRVNIIFHYMWPTSKTPYALMAGNPWQPKAYRGRPLSTLWSLLLLLLKDLHFLRWRMLAKWNNVNPTTSAKADQMCCLIMIGAMTKERERRYRSAAPPTSGWSVFDAQKKKIYWCDRGAAGPTFFNRLTQKNDK